MLKYAILLAIGIAIGYGYGWKDAQEHDQNVVERTIDRVGGSNRGKYNADIDKTMEKVER